MAEGVQQDVTTTPPSDQDRRFEDSYILGNLIRRGQYSTLHKCLFKGKSERACRIYRKDVLDNEKLKSSIHFLIEKHHDGIIQIFDAFEAGDQVKIVCERSHGPELFDKLVLCGHYSEKEASQLAFQMFHAVMFLHNAGIVHGDIRPESFIFASPFPYAPLKLRDVSFAFQTTRMGGESVFNAPEEVHRLTPETDMWAIGIVLFIMLCGLEPVGSITKRSIESAFEVNDRVSNCGKNVVIALLEGDPKKRLSAARAIQQAWTLGVGVRNSHMVRVLNSIREFNACRKFKAATAVVMATQRLSTHPIKETVI